MSTVNFLLGLVLGIILMFVHVAATWYTGAFHQVVYEDLADRGYHCVKVIYE